MTEDDNLDSSSSSDVGSRVDLSDDHQWEDVEPDEEKISVVSLFDEESFPKVQLMLNYCKEHYGFDLVKIREQFDLEFFELVKLVNYIRSEVIKGNKNFHITSKSIFEDDQYLQPVLQDDALLFSLDEVTGSSETSVTEKLGIEGQGAVGDEITTLKHVTELQEELQRVQQQFKAYREAVDKTLEAKWGTEGAGAGPSNDDVREHDPAKESKNDDSGYFTSYSYNEIHEIMLKDTIRTDAYRDFIYSNKNLFKDKTVLDVGCGTGILSMFCAKAGAARVIAVDNSDIIDKARENVFVNELGDIITCVRGKIEEVTLPVTKVDIIVSEWMGYCLLYEAMLDSVLWARDHYLQPDGLMIPSHITLFLAPFADPDYIADHVAFWRSVYGFKMDSMLAHIYDEVLIRDVDLKNLPGPATPFFRLNLYSITADQLEFDSIPFTIKLREDIDNLDGFVIWFDTFFLASKEASRSLGSDVHAENWAKDRGIAFTTGPGGRSTHWGQGILLVDQGKSGPRPLEKNLQINGTIGYKKRKDNQRALDIELEWAMNDSMDHGRQSWNMH